MALNVTILPAFDDNYIYLLTCSETGTTAVIDPGDGRVVADYLGEHGRLDYILCTHHHADHTGGNLLLKELYNCMIIGSQYDADKGRIDGLDIAVEEDAHLDIGESIATVINAPGHTLGHILFWFTDEDLLFCGDTLFLGGCGRLFEGTAEQMFHTLWKIKALPPQTQIYCGHEYTKSNYKFLQKIAPDNAAVAHRWAEVKKLRSQGKPTVPSTLLTEMGSNLFLKAESVAEFKALRLKKDNF